MKKKMIFCISLVVGLFLGGATTVKAQGQNSDAAIRQEIRGLAMQTLQKGYEVYATCSNVDYMEKFVDLFKDKNVMVYNDLLGLAKGRELPAEKYAQILGQSGVKSPIVTISGISILDEPYKENGRWKIDIAFNKRMAYYTACGVYFNSNDFYHADYNLEATLVYDELDKVCRIERITGGIDSYDELPDQYFVLKLTDEWDRSLTYRQRPIKFNNGNQALIAGEYNPAAFRHTNSKLDKKLQPLYDEDCLTVTMNYGSGKATARNGASFLLRPHFDLGLGGLSIDGGNDISASSSSYGFGVDFGLPIMEGGSLKLNAFAGLGLNMSTIDMDYSHDKSISIKIDKDIDGDPYDRHYNGLSVSQSVKLTELAIPVYADAEFNLSSGLSLYGDLGLKFNFNIGSSSDINSVKVNKISGYYEIYKITLDGYWEDVDGKPYEGFTNEVKVLNATMSDDPSGVSGMTFDIIGGAGLRYNFPNSPIAIDLGMKFQLGMSEMVKSEGDSSKFVIKYESNEDHKGGVEHISNLANMLTSVKRNALALSIGLVFKF